MASARVLVVGICLVCLTVAVTLAGDDGRRFREQGQFASEGAFRGFTLPGTASVQHEKVLELWKKLYEKEPPTHQETDRFLLFGPAGEKKLKEAGVLLEKTYALAAKTLDLDGESPWSGKLAVYIVGNRGEMTSLVRIVEKRRAEEGDQGSFEIDGTFPHVIAGPPIGKADLSPEQQAGEQIAAALLTRKAGRAVPHWVQMAFGRATVLRAGPLKDLGLEHRRVALLINKSRKGIIDVINSSSLDADDTTVLRASMMEYLAYSGRTAKFMPFLKGFQPSETMPEPKIEQALDAANLNADKLNAVWINWAKTFR